MPEYMMVDRLLNGVRDTESFARLDSSITAGALRAIRAQFEANSNPFDRYRAISAQIVATDNVEWQRLLTQLRDEFETKALATKIGEIEQMFARSHDEGWNSWLRGLGEALSRFRHSFAMGLCRHGFPFDASREQTMKELGRAVECARQSRWEEAYEELVYLSTQEALPAPTRARLIAVRGQIELFRFGNPAKARPLFEEAAAIAPEDGWILASLGDYWQGEQNAAKAVALYQRAMEVAPDDPTGYVGMGDGCEKQGHVDEAEAWYRKAIALAGGDSLGYVRLLSVVGRPTNLTAHEDEFLTLLKKAIAVDPEGEYDVYLSAGGYYLAAARPSEARAWYQKAIRLESDWPRGYTELAEFAKTQGNLEEAETLCRKAIEVASDCPTAYLVLRKLYEEQSRWAEALSVYEAFPQRPRQWVSFARASIGRMQAKLGNYEEAARVLRDALHEELIADETPTQAERALEEIAEDAYKQRSDTESAIRIYDEILQAVGTRYTGKYHNLLGNLHYFFDHYQPAIDEYRKAIAAAPENAAYHRYLSTAYGSLGEYDHAAEELDRAFRIDHDEKLLHAGKASLANSRGNRAFENSAYAEAVKYYTKAVESDSSDAVYHTNLAGALERLKERGKGLQYLDQAAGCYERAQQLSKTEDYTQLIDRLRRRAAFVRVYGERPLDFLNVVTPIAVEVAADLIPSVEGAAPLSLSEGLSASVKTMRVRVLEQLGLQIPGIRIRGNDEDLPYGTYIVMINEIPLVSGSLSLDRRFWAGPAESLSQLGVSGEPAPDPVTGNDGFWIDRNDWVKLESHEPKLWSITDYLMRHVEAVVRRNAADLLGHQEVMNLLKSESAKPAEEIRASSGIVTAFATVCRALVAEEVPIRPFEDLCVAFTRIYANNVSPREIVEHIRGLAPFRTLLPGNEGQRSLLKLSARFETEIRRWLYGKDGRLMLAMEPERCQQALTAVRDRVNNRSHALVVADGTLRPFVRRLVELEFPNLPVLSQTELRDDAPIASANVIDLDGEPTAGCVEFRSGTRRADESVLERGKDLRRVAPALNDIRLEVFVSENFGVQPSAADDMNIGEMFSLMQDGLFYELGITLPDVQLTTDRNVKSEAFRFRLNGVDYALASGLRADEFLVNDTVDRLTLLDIQGRKAVNPANGTECAIVQETKGQIATCKLAGLTTWGPRGFLVLSLSAEIRRAAAQFQADEVTQYNLDSVAEAFPDLVRFVLERYTLSQIALLLRDLLEEEISIRDLRSILESLLSINGTTAVDLNRFIVFLAYPDWLCPAPARDVRDLTTSQLADFVRMSLRRHISNKYTRGGNTLVVYLMDPAIENWIGQGPLTEPQANKLRAAIREEVGTLPATVAAPVLLTTFEVRRTLRKIIERDFPRLAVVSYQELSPDMNIQPIARISW
jgi:type III secretory pathway component EscV/tetratricopeptide (TPR) repeat protein